MSKSPTRNADYFTAAVQHISQLFSEVAEEMEWLWEGMLPTGTLAALVAFMKVGKTTLAFQLAVAVARGELFLGFPTKQSGVLIISLEENKILLRDRLRKYGATDTDPIWVMYRPDLWKDAKKPGFYDELRHFCISNGIGLIIIDSLSRFAMFKDENANAEVTRFMNLPLTLAHDTNTVVLFLHHESKAGGESGRGIRGAGSILGAVDVALTMSRVVGNSPNDRTFEVLGRYQEYAPGKLRLSYENGSYISDGLEEEQSLAAKKDKVLGALNEVPRKVEEIAESAVLGSKPTRTALQALFTDKKVGREGDGKKGDPHKYYRLRDEGTRPFTPSKVVRSETSLDAVLNKPALAEWSDEDLAEYLGDDETEN